MSERDHPFTTHPTYTGKGCAICGTDHSGEASVSAPTTPKSTAALSSYVSTAVKVLKEVGEVSAPAPTPTRVDAAFNEAWRIASSIEQDFERARFLFDAGWRYRVAASEVQTAPDTEWIKKSAEELDGVYMDHVGERALSVTLVEQIIERNYRMSLTASGVQTAPTLFTPKIMELLHQRESEMGEVQTADERATAGFDSLWKVLPANAYTPELKELYRNLYDAGFRDGVAARALSVTKDQEAQRKPK